MARTQNPKATFHTVQIQHEVFQAMVDRATALRLSSAQYVSKLISADTVESAGAPIVIYPFDYKGKPFRFSNQPPPEDPLFPKKKIDGEPPISGVVSCSLMTT
jgi:hypothetical protein